MTLDKHSEAAFPARFLVNFYQDDIGSDLADTLPGDHIFRISSQEPAQLPRSRNNESQHGSGAAVDLQVADAAERAAGADIDHFFPFQIT